MASFFDSRKGRNAGVVDIENSTLHPHAVDEDIIHERLWMDLRKNLQRHLLQSCHAVETVASVSTRQARHSDGVLLCESMTGRSELRGRTRAFETTST
jgi:hypothetical protein